MYVCVSVLCVWISLLHLKYGGQILGTVLTLIRTTSKVKEEGADTCLEIKGEGYLIMGVGWSREKGWVYLGEELLYQKENGKGGGEIFDFWNKDHKNQLQSN